MELVYYTSAICLIGFMIIATYDGAYLHLWKYELFNRAESKFEHLTHTLRALLFPAIVWLIFLNHDPLSFWIGMGFILVDFVVLGIDAYSEKDSREFMGGLPRNEYILHLFANGFHFASIFLILSTKLILVDATLSINEVKNTSFGAELLEILAMNLLPGAIILGLLHLLLTTQFGQRIWMNCRNRIACC